MELAVSTPALPQSNRGKIKTFRAPAPKWWQAIAFCGLLSCIGLRLYPMVLPLLAFLVWRWRSNRYDFLVELIIFLGGFGLMPLDVLPIRAADIGLILSLIGFVIYRKNVTVKRLTVATFAYIAALILIALTSVESMSIQFYRLRNYLYILAYFIPLLVFANRKFNWSEFMDSVVLHALVITGFYVVDTFLINGFLLLPGTMSGGGESSIFDLYIAPMFVMPRHYPPGLYWLIPCVYAMNYKRLRFSVFQWLIILLALYASRTNSLLFALLGCWIFFRANLKQTMLYAFIGGLFIFAGYHIDNATGGYLRLASNVDQFISLEAAQDNEDLAEFGTGRMAQILPKWELLDDMNRLGLGFGFIHPEKTKNPIFQIRNEYYTGDLERDEVATEVEVTQVQTILDVGFIGLFIQMLYYIGIYFIFRKMRYSGYYLCVLVGVSLLGVGGFAGLIHPHGLLLLATFLGAILAANKDFESRQSLKSYA